jgi:DNA-binding FadR family transcriptional regulator
LVSPPIRRERLHDQVTRYLALEILRGTAPAGEPGLDSEADLCRHLQVSRTVVRESVKVLAAKGLVEVRPKAGIRVKPREAWNLLDPDLLSWQHEAGVDDLFVRNLCEVRLIVEAAAAELAAVRGTDEDLEQIRRSYELSAAMIHDKLAYGDADVRFHEAIFVASRNELLRQMSSTIGLALRRTQDPTCHLPADVGLPLHSQVKEAILKRDGRAARKAMEALVLHAAEMLYGVLHPGRQEEWKKLSPQPHGAAALRSTKRRRANRGKGGPSQSLQDASVG